MSEQKRVIEIDGVKMEIDLRTAKKVETNYKVGCRVKALEKKYGDTYTIKRLNAEILAQEQKVQELKDTKAFFIREFDKTFSTWFDN